MVSTAVVYLEIPKGKQKRVFAICTSFPENIKIFEIGEMNLSSEISGTLVRT